MRKKQERNKKKMIENNEEINEIQEENEPEMEEDVSPLDITPSEEEETLYDIKNQLIEKGLTNLEDVKFILKKKDNKGRYTYVSTFYGHLPEMDEIGERFRGGDYIILVHAGGKYRLSKTFAISQEAYPIITHITPIQENTISRDLIHEERLDKMREELKQEKEETEQKTKDMMSLFLSQIAENNKMLLQILTTKKDTSLDDTLKIISTLKAVENNKSDIDYNRVFDIVGNAFNNGLTLALQMVQKKDDEDLGDVLIGVVKSFAKNINPDILTKTGLSSQSVSEKQIEKSGFIEKEKEKDIANKILLIVQEYFQMVKLAYDEGEDIDFLIHLACKTEKYKIIKMYVQKFDNITLEQFISQAGFSHHFADEDFKNYVLDILDNIRNYDNIIVEDKNESNIDENEVVKNDGTEKQNTDNGDSTMENQ